MLHSYALFPSLVPALSRFWLNVFKAVKLDDARIAQTAPYGIPLMWDKPFQKTPLFTTEVLANVSPVICISRISLMKTGYHLLINRRFR